MTNEPEHGTRPASSRLQRRAKHWGVELGYEDYESKWRTAPAATVEQILDVLGATGEHPPAATTKVARIGDPVDVARYAEIELEDGGSETLDGALPPDVPPGYHRLVGRDGTSTRLILSPGVCWLPERLGIWGWAVQLYSLRSNKSWGVGDLGDLSALASWARSETAGALLLNPLHASNPGREQQPSPYFPSSRCFRNLLYLRIEDIPGATELGPALGELQRHGKTLNEAPLIARGEVYELKLRALERVWQDWRGSRGFDEYLDEHGPLLEDYATFVALAENHGGGPATWPAELSHPRAQAVSAWRDANRDRVTFHQWVQWLIDEQLQSASSTIGLVNDLAIGVDPQGADAWLWQDVFARGLKVGAPPDEFSAHGQDWGVPPFDPWKLRESEYEPFIQMIRASLRHSAGVRIDHVMGLFRLFWIPENAGAEDGTYVRYPHEDLLNIVALESHRARGYVVGEDLGTVEDRVRSEMRARKLLSYRLMWFEEEDPQSYPGLALAAVTNHDLPTIAGMWSGKDLQIQIDLGLDPNIDATEKKRQRLRDLLGVDDDAPVDEVIERTYRLLARAPSAITLATLEDALAVEERPNIPGSKEDRPNWRLPLPVRLEDIERQRLPRAIAGALGAR